MSRQHRQLLFVALLSLGVLVHSHGDGSRMGVHAHTVTANTTDAETTPYFVYVPHRGWLYLHIFTMLFAWLIVMPISTMFSIARSRYHVPVQITFLCSNAAGLVLGIIYNSLTPDLYPGNSHHKLGWTLLMILGVQAAIGVIGTIVRRSALWNSSETRGFMAIPASPISPPEPDWPNRDSGEENFGYNDLGGQEWTPAGVDEKVVRRLQRFLASKTSWIFNSRVVAICNFLYSLIARMMIPLGFTQICLGVVTGSGIFMGSGVFNGLAHFIKGGIFFLYGIFTFGRWLGAFADLGWAWNIPPTPTCTNWHTRTPFFRRIPSEETITSAIIFTYGCLNVFLEHLAGWGSEWAHEDLQHVSIAFMFLGGGLLGLLVESQKLRSLLHSSISEENEEEERGKKGRYPSNPLPAMVIFILGILMSQHHQHSRLSTVIHTQWGVLFASASAFRLLTYMLFFRAPPTGVAPSRPPTEPAAAFCLVAGGLVFMASSRDTVAYLERIGVDAMFSLTVTVGFSALLLSWVTVVMALKGWAVKREMRGR